MKIISSNNTYDIFDNSLRTYDKLPAQYYAVRFEQFRGFYLEKHSDIEISEDKVYGVHKSKVEKVFNSFKMFTRNLGIILSGDKGMGKSLFAKMVCVEAVNKGIPVIIIDKYIENIASYIERIDQEAVVLFDEFDKTYGDIRVQEGSASPQSQLLSLFDGVSGGKKMFVITCNDIRGLSDYLINRTGRFHYHFRFEYPTTDEIREYLADKLDERFYGEINAVVAFSRRINLNYDCLRAIAFELNMGISFKEAILDLNIINYNDNTRYNITLRYSNGFTAGVNNYRFDPWSADESDIWLTTRDGDCFINVRFDPRYVEYDIRRGENIIPVDKINVSYDDDSRYKELIDSIKNSTIESLTLSKIPDRNIHYMV